MDWSEKYPKDRPAKLRAAAEFIEAIPTEEFNIEHWWLKDGVAWDSDRNVTYRVSTGPCGCAIGHMIHRGSFGIKEDDLNPNGFPTESIGRQAVFVRVGDAFGIGYKLAEFMFDQYAYDGRRRGDITPIVVAKRIRFVADELDGMDK